MMKKIVFLAVIIATLISCKTETKKTENTQPEDEIVLKETPLIALEEFDSKAGDFISEEIKVQGIVDHVCKHGGKKILLVTDDGQVHITSDVRFDEALMGSEITVAGIVLEERIDEGYCLKMEDDNIKSHADGNTSKEQFEARKEFIAQYRAQMKADSVDHISNYSLKYVSHTEVK